MGTSPDSAAVNSGEEHTSLQGLNMPHLHSLYPCAHTVFIKVVSAHELLKGDLRVPTYAIPTYDMGLHRS